MDIKKIAMQKVVINSCYGGFGLSVLGLIHYFNLKNIKFKCYKFYADNVIDINNYGYDFQYYEYDYRHVNNLEDYGAEDFIFTDEEGNQLWAEVEIKRDDWALVKTVEDLKNKVNTRYSKLRVVEIPQGINWKIIESEGMEYIIEESKVWK